MYTAGKIAIVEKRLINPQAVPRQGTIQELSRKRQAFIHSTVSRKMRIQTDTINVVTSDTRAHRVVASMNHIYTWQLQQAAWSKGDTAASRAALRFLRRLGTYVFAFQWTMNSSNDLASCLLSLRLMSSIIHAIHDWHTQSGPCPVLRSIGRASNRLKYRTNEVMWLIRVMLGDSIRYLFIRQFNVTSCLEHKGSNRRGDRTLVSSKLSEII